MNKIERLFKLAQLLLPAFLEAHKEEIGERTGIALGIKSHNSDKIRHVRKIGILDTKRFYEKKAFVEEKIYRMYNNEELCSFQSEDESKGSYGGGIRTENFLIAPSGLPPHLDQEFGLQLALMAGEISYPMAIAIKALSYHKVEYWKKKVR